MTREIKRGAPYPSGEERQKAKALAPYPTWGRWGPTIESNLNVDLGNLRNGVEEIFEEVYTTRRLIQKGADSSLWDELRERIEEEHPRFLDDSTNQKIMQFIVNRTEPDSVREKAKRFREGF